MNHSDEEKAELISCQQLHLKTATDARQYMNHCIERCKAELNGISTLSLEPVAPLSGPDQAHYGFDFAQQVSCLSNIKRLNEHFRISTAVSSIVV